MAKERKLSSEEVTKAQIRLVQLLELRRGIEDVDSIKVVARIQNKDYNITEFCPLEFGPNEMDVVVINLEEELEKTRNCLGIMNGGTINARCESID